MRKFGKKSLTHRAAAKLSKMFGVHNLTPGNFFIKNIYDDIRASFKHTDEAPSANFAELTNLYQLSERELQNLSQVYRRQAGLYLVSLFILFYFAVSNFFHDANMQSFVCYALVAVFIILSFLKSRYCVYVIEQRTLAKGFFKWLFALCNVRGKNT